MSQTKAAELSVGNEVYGFDAIRGVQATHEFYVAMCPLKIIPKLFIFNDHDIPPELRAQRTLRKARIPAIKNYILNNPDSYIFSSLTASVDGNLKFVPAPSLGAEGKLGRLYINMDSRMLINDGQHRRQAIEEALKENPDLGHEMISVVFFQDKGLKRSQQMFSDLNKNAVKPTKSLNILYDHRDEFSKYIVGLVNIIQVFEGRVDLEKTSISNRSKKAFTLNGISDATKRLLGKNKVTKITNEEKELVKEFWEIVSTNMNEWQLMINGKMTPYDLRQGYVNTHTNVLNLLGILGNVLIKEYPNNWKEKLRGLKKVDWSRDNPEWNGNLIVNGQMHRAIQGIQVAVNIVLEKIGIELSESRLRYKS